MDATRDRNEPLLTPGLKGFPHHHAPVARRDIGKLDWHVLADDLPLPVALLKRTALEHNLAWMQRFAQERGIDLAPHGKTTMSPQLFKRQLDAGAWGLTVANVTQLAVAVAAGARCTLIANQVMADVDLAAIRALRAEHVDLRVVFLVDSIAQTWLIEAWFAAHPGGVPFDVMLEIGVHGGRTGCRTHDDAVALARRLHASTAVRPP